MKSLSGISLKYRLLIVLIVLPAAALGLYLLLASRLFSEDKIAYVYDSASWISRTLADQSRNEVQALNQQVQEWLNHYNDQQKKFDVEVEKSFQRQSEVRALAVYELDSAGTYIRVGYLGAEKGLQTLNRIPDKILNWIRSKELFIGQLNSNAFLLGFKIRVRGESQFRIVVLERESQNFLSGFRKKGTYFSILSDSVGRQVVRPADIPADFGNLSEWSFFRALMKKPIPEGTAQAHSRNGNRYLASFSSLGTGGLMVVSFVDEAAALEAVSLLKVKSALFFLIVISAATMISVFASGKLTATLRDLYRATRKIGEGNFNVEIDVNSSDEVGKLAEGFNTMAAEVSRLMTETAEKARMEKELETARTVQETLFPPAQARLSGGSISGFFYPATECGGDWWHYSQIGDRIFIWIGDATGHGAPAALITSAAKSAAAVIERLGIVTPEIITPQFVMQLLNRAIHETSRGKMLMTFFLACLDRNTGVLTYCNASHDPPYLLKNLDKALRKKDILPLNDVRSPRLGEKQEVEFEEAKIQLNENDLILFYTDGLNDVKNPDREAWGESRFLRSALEIVSKTRDADEFSGLMQLASDDFRKGSLLDDDVTFFVFKRELTTTDVKAS